MWQQMKQTQLETYAQTRTENGAASLATTGSNCLDLFATVGALREASAKEIIKRFSQAWAENPEIALRILFFARDVRGGLGERRVGRIMLNWLANSTHYQSVRKNIAYIPEYGRYDDLLALLGTQAEDSAVTCIQDGLDDDRAALSEGRPVSLLAKWLPSVNASNKQTIAAAKRIAKLLGLTDAQYRRTLSKLRKRMQLLENNLREREYSFEYEKQPSKALYKYRKAFLRNDGERYRAFLARVATGEAKLHTAALAPYDIIRPIVYDENGTMPQEQRAVADATWRSLEDFTDEENALVVVDGSGSMYANGNPMPATVAMSLAIYFAERNKGQFQNRFITFSTNPRLVEIPQGDIYEKVRYCMQFDEIANTDIERVFRLILDTAVHNHMKQDELPSTVYVITDMEFDACAENAEITNFENVRALFAEHGYTLPRLVFWNVQSRNEQQPVLQNEQGVALVSGCTPRLFSMLKSGTLTPYGYMLDIVNSERYANIHA